MVKNEKADVPFVKKGKEPQADVPDYLLVPKPVNALLVALFVLLAICCVGPAVFCLIISFSSEASIAKIGYSFFPAEVSLNSYIYLWNTRGLIGMAFIISIIVTIVGTAIGLFLNATMAYTLSRPTFYLRSLYTIIILIPMLFGGGMVASYMVNSQVLHLRNTIWALILPIGVGTWYIVIMRTFFQTTIPDSIVESGKIDGASQLMIFFQIVLPISLPALATIGLFLTFAYWNDWFSALLYIDSQHVLLYPLQYVLVSIQKNIEFLTNNQQLLGGNAELVKNIPSETMRMAIVMVIVVPIACAYPFFQRYFVTGLTIGAVKG